MADWFAGLGEPGSGFGETSFASNMYAGGAILGAYGAITQGIDQRKALNAQARYYELSAAQVMRGTKEQTRALAGKAASVQGAQRASYAGQGVETRSGSAASVQGQTQRELEAVTDAMMKNARLEAWGLREQASWAKKSASQAQRGAWIGAAGSLIGGFGMAAAL